MPCRNCLLILLAQTFERKDSMSVHVADDAHLDADRSQLIRSQGLLVDTETLKATRTQCELLARPSCSIKLTSASSDWLHVSKPLLDCLG